MSVSITAFYWMSGTSTQGKLRLKRNILSISKETYFLFQLASHPPFPSPPTRQFLSLRLFSSRRCDSFPLLLHAISPESCSGGCASRPTKPINRVYVIDPSACLVYTMCARLRPKEMLTFHTRGSPPSLSRIIVQLKSQSEPIMWEGFAEDRGGKNTLVC